MVKVLRALALIHLTSSGGLQLQTMVLALMTDLVGLMTLMSSVLVELSRTRWVEKL
jgi:sorbitol-specific phosphotransferase system component IIC